MEPKLECPFCHASLERKAGLPAWMDVDRMVGEHPLPLVGGYVKTRFRQATQTITSHVSWSRCPRCGFIALFER